MTLNVVSGSPDRIAIVLLALLWLLPLAFASETVRPQDAEITFVHTERSLQPGEVVLINADSARPLRRLRIEVFGRKFPAFAEDNGIRWTGLVGIDLETKPGSYAVRLNGIDLEGTIITALDTLEVGAKEFPTRRLTVDEKFVTPPAEALSRIKLERERVNAIFASTTPEKLWHGSFLLPVPGKVISAFGKRNIYNGQPRSPHTGTDFRGASGTPIRAPNAGNVVLAADLYYSGNTVILDHGLGMYSYLGHMSSFSVKEGEQVKAGDIIGKVGATGQVTGPHLHWTVRLVESRIDPLSLVSILGSAK